MPDTVVSIAVTLATSALSVGSTTTASARVTTDVGDNTLDQQTILWTSSAPTVATVTATTTGAVVRAVAPGTANIRAAAGPVIGAAVLTVAVPVVDITAAQATAIGAMTVGSQFMLKEVAPGVRSYTVQVSA